MDAVFNVVGIAGALLILAAYFLLQAEKVKSDSLRYLGLNLIGSLGLLLSLLWDWNLPSFVIEICWLTISLYGVIKTLKHKRKKVR